MIQEHIQGKVRQSCLIKSKHRGAVYLLINETSIGHNYYKYRYNSDIRYLMSTKELIGGRRPFTTQGETEVTISELKMKTQVRIQVFQLDLTEPGGAQSITNICTRD